MQDFSISQELDELTLLLGANLSIHKAVDLVLSSKAYKNHTRFLKLKEDIYSGIALHQAIKSSYPSTPETFISLVALAEKSNKLGSLLALHQKQLAQLQEIQSNLQKCLRYPLLILLVMLLNLALFSFLVVPNLQQVFTGKLDQLSGFTQVVFVVAEFFTQYSLVLPLLLVVLILVSYANERAGLGFSASLAQFIPGMKNWLKEANLALASDVVGNLLQARLDLRQAWVYMKEQAFSEYRKDFIALDALLAKGAAFDKALSTQKNLPSLFTSLLIQGYRSHNLIETFTKLGIIYNQKAKRRQELLAFLVPNILMLIMAIFVGCMIFAIYIPLFSIGANLG